MPDAAFQFLTENAPTIDDFNDLSARLYALNKDCPGKTWWDADPMHPAIARALRIEMAEEGAVFAKVPFRLAKLDGAHVILAAYPSPRCLGPVDGDWLGIETVIAWSPQNDAATILGDDTAQLTGRLTDDTPAVFGSPRIFFTAWMRARAEFFVRWVESRKGTWRHGATEYDLAPGALAIGPLDRIQWRPSALPQNIEAVGIDPAKLNKAILKAARVPRAFAASNDLRSAA